MTTQKYMYVNYLALHNTSDKYLKLIALKLKKQ